MIGSHKKSFFGEFQSLLDGKRLVDLARLFSLMKRIDELEPLKALFQQHVKQQGLNLISQLSLSEADPKSYVESILEVYRQHLNLVLDQFSNDAGFMGSLDKVRRIECAALSTWPLVAVPFSSCLVFFHFSFLIFHSWFHSWFHYSLNLISFLISLFIEFDFIISSFLLNWNELRRLFHLHLIDSPFTKQKKQFLINGKSRLKACRDFVNRNALCLTSSSKSPELLARYCDFLLKKSANHFDVDVLEASLDSTVQSPLLLITSKGSFISSTLHRSCPYTLDKCWRPTLIDA